MDDGDSIARFIWIAIVLTVVASSLFARRIPLVRMITWSMAWVALFFGVYLLFDQFGPQFTAWQQSRRGGEVSAIQSSAASPSASASVAGRSVSIPMNEDGHFWVSATANGRPIRFLIDSGASITALSRASATDLGLSIDTMRGSIILDTANGSVSADRSSIALVEIEGAIRASDLPVVVSESFGNTNVLGMNFLNKLKSWRVEDGKMILQAR